MAKKEWVTSVGELTDLRYEWDRLQKESGISPFTSYSMNSVWFESFPSDLPRVLTLREGRDLIAIVPMALSETKVLAIKAKTLAFTGGLRGTLMYSHLGALIAKDHPDAVGAIADEIRRADWDILRLRFIPEGGAMNDLVARLKAIPPIEEQQSTYSVMCPFPPTGNVMANFSKKLQDNVRYKTKRLEKEGRLELRTVQVEDVDRAIDVHARQHVERWRGRGGSLFSKSENVAFLKLVLKECIPRGTGFMNELLIDDEVAAQDLGLLDGSTAWMYRGGMNQAYTKHSPGVLLHCLEMERFRQMGLSAINLGRGKDDYKMQLGGRAQLLLSLQGMKRLVRIMGGIERTLPGERRKKPKAEPCIIMDVA